MAVESVQRQWQTAELAGVWSVHLPLYCLSNVIWQSPLSFSSSFQGFCIPLLWFALIEHSVSHSPNTSGESYSSRKSKVKKIKRSILNHAIFKLIDYSVVIFSHWTKLCQHVLILHIIFIYNMYWLLLANVFTSDSYNIHWALLPHVFLQNVLILHSCKIYRL